MIKQPLSPSTKKHLQSIEKDDMSLFILENGSVRGALLSGTALINQMRANHDLGIMETLILGHAYLGAGVISRMLKGEDRIVLSVECGGPVKGLSVEVKANGQIRGYLKESNLQINKELKSFDTSPFFGPGFLSVTKHIGNAGNPFTGQVMIEHGRLAKDLAHYFLTSEQIPTAIILSVYFNKQGEAEGAGALFLQALPDAPDDALSSLEETIEKLPSLGKYFAGGGSREKLMNEHFSRFSPTDHGTQKIEFNCACSKERFSSFLSGISDNEKHDILKKKDFPLKTTCFNCNTTYKFTEKEVHTLFSN